MTKIVQHYRLLLWHIDLEGRPRKEFVARCGVHVQWNGSIVVYKFCLLCCCSLKAGSFLIFVCLALCSLGNLHKSQKAFTELGWIEVVALVCFCIILNINVYKCESHKQTYLERSLKAKKQAEIFSHVYLFVYVLLFSRFPLSVLAESLSHCLLSSFVSVSKEIDALYFWHTIYSCIIVCSWRITSDARGAALFGTADHH